MFVAIIFSNSTCLINHADVFLENYYSYPPTLGKVTLGGGFKNKKANENSKKYGTNLEFLQGLRAAF